VASVLALTAVAFTVLAVNAVRQAGAGSYTSFLVVAPVLAALIASAIRPSPGVGDTEFDWIVAIIFAAGGLLAIELLSQRLPALSGLWNWDHFRPIVWAIAAAMIIFSVRHVLRLWRTWVFALLCAPAMPFLLLTSHLGGTEDAAVLLAAVLGTVAVYLATSTFRTSWRLIATTANLVVATGLGHLLGWHDLLGRTVVVAGVVPVLTVLAVRHVAHVRVAASIAAHPAKGTARFPRVGARSYGVLVLLAASLLLTSPPVSAVQPTVQASGDWIARLNLHRTAEFDFIRRFVGPGATLTRYTLTTPNPNPAVAIDVIAASNLARLSTYSDAVWYPSSTPVNYRSADIDSPTGLSANTAQSDADSASTDPSGQWYALTWLWQAGTVYQRVTVVVNQDLSAAIPPPAPRPIGWTNTLLEPMLWLSRQQPAPTGVVPKRVVRAADDVARQILAAGGGR